MQNIEYLRSYFLLPFQIAINMILLMLGMIIIFIIISIGKWVYPIMHRKISSFDDLKNKRSAVRQQHHESVLIYESNLFSKSETTFTLNVSKTGCLILTNFERQIDDILTINFSETGEVKTAVVRRLLYSSTNKTIGVGIEYI